MENLFRKEKITSAFLYSAVFLVGASVLIVEILGTRILAPFYGSTIFVWSSLLSVTLASLALGYILGGKLADRAHSYRSFFGIVFSVGVVIFALYLLKPAAIVWSDVLGIKFAPLSAAAILFGLPMVLFGMVSPYAIRLTTRSAETSGSSSGTIFAVATLGSLFGALFGGFFLIPNYPNSSILYWIVFTLMAIGVAGMLFPCHTAAHREKSRKTNNRFFLAICLPFAVLPIALFVRGLDGVRDSIHKMTFEQEIVFEESNFYGINRLIGQPRASDGRLCFLIDGTIQGCIDKNNPRTEEFVPIQALAATLPDNSSFLMLGLGLGEYFHATPDWSRLSVQVVDVNPAAFISAALARNEENPGYDAYLGDARQFLRRTDSRYDLIFTDLLSNLDFPEYAFTKEALGLVRDRLAEKGAFIFSVVGRADGADAVVNSMVTTAKSVFPHVYIYSERPDKFFSYNLILASNGEVDLAKINSGITSEHESSFFEASGRLLGGRVVTDDSNPLFALWSDNLSNYLESPRDLRMKFKRLSFNDFYD